MSDKKLKDKIFGKKKEPDDKLVSCGDASMVRYIVEVRLKDSAPVEALGNEAGFETCVKGRWKRLSTHEVKNGSWGIPNPVETFLPKACASFSYATANALAWAFLAHDNFYEYCDARLVECDVKSSYKVERSKEIEVK